CVLKGRLPMSFPWAGRMPSARSDTSTAATSCSARSRMPGSTSQRSSPPSGSAGMRAGPIVGPPGAGRDMPRRGIHVSRSAANQEPKVVDLVDPTATSLDPPPVPRDRTVALGDYFGTGYALPTERMVEAVRLFARTEGILLDPVYTGKA